jgi:formate dehydrogenase major subunit
MNTPGIPSTRWHDATLLAKDQVGQTDNIKCMFVMGHGGNTVTRMPEAARAIANLELLVVADPHPTTWAVLGERKNDTYLLPVATSYETDGSRVASNRAMQWGEQIVKPIFESKDDLEIMYLLAKKLGFADRMFRNIKVNGNLPVAEDILREINRGGWSTGYCGQSPERIKSHMAHQADFDMRTQKATTGPNKGDYYGLPWPCWGSPAIRHPGTPLLYNTNLSIKEGGGTFRARFGVEREEKLPDGSTRKVSLLGNGYYSKDSEIKDGYPEFTYGVLKKLGWDKDLTEAELAVINKVNPATPDAVSWSIDLSGGIQRVAIEHGCIPYGNGKARANAFGLPDPIPVHREPIYTPRAELVEKYPTLPDAKQFRLPNIGFTVQKAAVEKGIAKQFPLILSSGRLVEYEGGGEETRSNKWLAELQQDMFIEINPVDAADRGIKDGSWVLVSGAEMPSGKVCRMKALVTERVGKGVTWTPFHFAGWFMSEDQRGKYPKGADPIVLGESVNTLTTYGYDPVTGMQEPKATLCQIRAA